MNNHLYTISLGESKAKSYRYSKALSESVKLLLRPVTLSLCISLGAERRLEFNRYLLLRLLAVLRQYTQCAWSAFRYHCRFARPTCNDFIIRHQAIHWTHNAIICYSYFSDIQRIKWVADKVLSRQITVHKLHI